MALAVGNRLGPYEIDAPIGAGGMGEVYRARDTRLGRDVAIKVLPAAGAADPERRSRFEREAKAIAALNHPNIVTIHAVEEADGVPFFAMEYVEGRTLGQIIPPHGLPLDELLRIAIPLTDAVAAAHQRGILHRDLKPANVMLTVEGRVKVLDFGLAKLKEELRQADEGLQPTAEVTGEGRILGTVAYMSPEQAEGKPVDQRSDVFSLGILLYEMTTGQRPFKGDTSVSVISAILKDTPGSVTNLRPDVPHDLGRILRRALSKDSERRYQTAKDLRNDLETLKEDLDSGEIARTATPLAPSRWMRRPWMAAATLVLVVGLVAGTWWISNRLGRTVQVPPAERAFDDFTLTTLTTEPVSDLALAVSPDGRYVAYVFVENFRQGLRVRQADSSASVQAVAPADVHYSDVTFSPDGSRLYYTTYPAVSGIATLYAVDVLGGTPRRLNRDVDRGVAFSPDGARLAFRRGFAGKGGSILTANSDGSGERTLVTRESPNESIADVAWSADGGTIASAAFDGRGVRIFTIDATTGRTQAVGEKLWDSVLAIAWPKNRSYLIAAASDYALADTSQLWQVDIPTGSVRRITKDIASYSRARLTADGRTLVTARGEWHGSLWVGPAAQPDRVAKVRSTPDTVAGDPVRWTGDDRIVYTADVSGNYDIWSVRPDGGDLRQLTAAPARDALPTLSPDGRYIAFLSNRDGHPRIWRMESDGSRQTQLTSGEYDSFPVAAADSRSICFKRYESANTPVCSVPIEGGKVTLLFGSSPPEAAAQSTGVPSSFIPSDASTDGSLIGSYFDNQKEQTRVLVVRPNDGTVRRLDIAWRSTGRPREGLYAFGPAGRSVTFVQTSEGTANLWRQPLEGGPPIRLTHYTGGDDIVAHAWSRDGKLLALVRGTAERHLVIMRDVGGVR